MEETRGRKLGFGFVGYYSIEFCPSIVASCSLQFAVLRSCNWWSLRSLVGSESRLAQPGHSRRRFSSGGVRACRWCLPQLIGSKLRGLFIHRIADSLFGTLLPFVWLLSWGFWRLEINARMKPREFGWSDAWIWQLSHGPVGNRTDRRGKNDGGIKEMRIGERWIDCSKVQ